jgi:hypothetical protein
MSVMIHSADVLSSQQQDPGFARGLLYIQLRLQQWQSDCLLACGHSPASAPVA